MFDASFSNMYELVDLSHTLSDTMPMTVPFGRVSWLDMGKGDFAHAGCLFLGEHHGTHVDAPGHLVAKRDPAYPRIEGVALDSFVGPCRVVHMPEKGDLESGEVRAEELEAWEGDNGAFREGDIVLFHFGWDSKWQVPSPAQHYTVGRASYYRGWPGLISDAAELLQERKIKLVGTDAPSIDTYRYAGPPDPEPCHPILQLGAVKIVICEGLENLRRLPTNGGFFMGLPIKIADGTGAPIRAIGILRKERSSPST